MIQKIKSYALTLVALLTFGAPILVPATAGAASCSNIANNVQEGANHAANNNSGGSGCGSGAGINNNSIESFASKVVNLFSIIVGIIAVIMIIYGGLRYITSGGSSEKVGAAKNSLIYAVIGLIIVALAQLIVHFVLNQASTIAPS